MSDAPRPSESVQPVRYQDYVIRDGKFVGEFEAMYASCDDPWSQKTEDMGSLSRLAGLAISRRLKERFGIRRVVEIGCGFGRYSNALAQLGLEVTGIDVSATATEKARSVYPSVTFETAGVADHGVIEGIKPDLIVMSHVTWYVLPQLRDLLSFLRRSLPDTMLFHIVSTFDAGEQKYGLNYFKTPEEIRAFFGMIYYEWGEIHSRAGTDAYFLAAWSAERLPLWQSI